MKPCIICDKAHPYKNLLVCDLCSGTYDTDEKQELIRIYYQNLYANIKEEDDDGR